MILIIRKILSDVSLNTTIKQVQRLQKNSSQVLFAICLDEAQKITCRTYHGKIHRGNQINEGQKFSNLLKTHTYRQRQISDNCTLNHDHQTLNFSLEFIVTQNYSRTDNICTLIILLILTKSAKIQIKNVMILQKLM